MRSDKTKRRRGAALVEFCFAVPLFALIIALIFFFGSALKNQQKVKSSARYTAWRKVLTASRPSAAELQGGFLGPGAGVGIVSGTGPAGTRQELVAQAGQRSAATGVLADGLVMGRFPAGSAAHLSVGFSTDVAAWERFTGDIEGAHVREGVPWARYQAEVQTEVTAQFLHELDRRVQQMDSTANAFADAIRGLYLRQW